jgi:hypothetical protein
MVIKKRTLLISCVFYNPLGHALEALKIATGFYKSNKNLEVHVALNAATTTELAEGCPWIKKVYPINLDDVIKNGKNAKCLRDIPKNWDYLLAVRYFEVSRLKGTYEYEKALKRYLKIYDEIFKYKAEGTMIDPNSPPKGLKYRKVKLTLQIPKKALEFAKRYEHNGLKVCLMLAGSAGPRYYPSVESWKDIIKAINQGFPDCKFYVTGVTSPSSKSNLASRTYTLGVKKRDVDELVNSFPNVIDCYDIGLWNQAALLHGCDLLIAPHTGFGFLASCVDTPWLVISGSDWPEYFFNHFPFYAVLPDDKNYPYLGKGKYSKHAGEWRGDSSTGNIPHFQRKVLRKKIPEIVKAVHLLLDKKFTYKKAMKTHEANIRRLGLDESKLKTYDNI